MKFNFNSGVLNGLGAFKAKRDKMTVRGLIMLMGLGAAFIVASFFIFNSLKIDDSWIRTKGEVVGSTSRLSDGSTQYTPIISYEVKGRTYKVTSNGSSSMAPSIGDEREVAYDPAQPNVAKVVETTGILAFLLLFPIVGLAILILVPIYFVKSLKRSRHIKHLMQSGNKLEGVLVDTSRGNSNSMVITVAAVDGKGETRNYVSDPILGAAGLALADFRNEPVPIDVYVDPSKPDDYYVDISDIPNLTPQRIGDLLKRAVQKNNPSEAQPIMNAQSVSSLNTMNPVATMSIAEPVVPLAAMPVMPVANEPVMPVSVPAPSINPPTEQFGVPQQPIIQESPQQDEVVYSEPIAQTNYNEPVAPGPLSTDEPQMPSRGTIQPPAPRS